MTLRHVFWLAIALTGGCATSTVSPPAEIAGAMVYANNCNRCHEFRSPTEFNGPRWSIITTHMRVVGGIPADESRAVFEYLKGQHHPPYIPVSAPVAALSPGDPAEGKALVQRRGCAGCHVIEGRGGKMGPPLDGVSHRRSEAFVLQQLRDPKLNDPASLMPNLGLPPEVIDAIWAYLQSLDGAEGS